MFHSRWTQLDGGRNLTDWSPLMEAQQARARQVQDELPALRHGREAEQAVLAVFLQTSSARFPRRCPCRTGVARTDWPLGRCRELRPTHRPGKITR